MLGPASRCKPDQIADLTTAILHALPLYPDPLPRRYLRWQNRRPYILKFLCPCCAKPITCISGDTPSIATHLREEHNIPWSRELHDIVMHHRQTHAAKLNAGAAAVAPGRPRPVTPRKPAHLRKPPSLTRPRGTPTITDLFGLGYRVDGVAWVRASPDRSRRQAQELAQRIATSPNDYLAVAAEMKIPGIADLRGLLPRT